MTFKPKTKDFHNPVQCAADLAYFANNDNIRMLGTQRNCMRTVIACLNYMANVNGQLKKQLREKGTP